MITTRRIRPEDGQQLRSIRLQALRDSPSAFGSSVSRELAFDQGVWSTRAVEAATGHLAATFVAQDQPTTQWLALVTVLGPTHKAVSAPSHAELVSMWVAPFARRKGLASCLLALAVDYAASLHVRQLRLSVARDNPSALALYEGYGFSRSSVTTADPPQDEIRLHFGLSG